MEKKNEIGKIYALSSMQEGMLFHSLLHGDSEAYFEQMIFSIDGKLNIEIFEQSFNMIIERHDIFRTNFVYKKLKKAQQVVFKKRVAKLHYEDISESKEEEKKSFIEDFKIKDKKRGFDLSKDTLIRISIFKTSTEEYKFIWSYHHILMDGWCLGIVMREIIKIYEGLIAKKANGLEEVLPYSNYIKWLKQQDKEEGLSYWKTYLQKYEQLVDIPKFKNKSNNSEYIRKEFILVLEKNIREELTKLAIKNQVTMSTIFQTTWGILLQKYNNVNDAVFGAVVSGRPAEVKGIEGMVGLFINTIPVRVKGDKISFSDLIKEVQKASIESEKYSYYPLYEIQANTKFKQELINNILVFENYPIAKEIKDLNDEEKMAFKIRDIEIEEQTSYDFNIVIGLNNNEIILKFLFNNSIYEERFIEKIGEHFTNILKCILEDEKVLVKDIEILSNEEKDKILCEFNNSYADYPRDKTIHELFEEQVEKTPNNIALVFEHEKLTYRQLNEKANGLAKTLREKGVKADSLVGIMVERSLDMVVGIMGILKAGGAYLPIDVEQPKRRIKYMLQDCRINILLTQGKLIPKIESIIKCTDNIADIEVLAVNIIDLEDEKLYEEFKGNLPSLSSSNNLAYVIYTSGSTGKPKGTEVMHYNISRVVKNTNYISITDEDIILQLSNYAFDGSVFDIFGALLNGAKLVLIDKEKVLNINKLTATIVNERISVFFITTALFNTLVDNKIECFKHVRKVLFGGERISIPHAKKALEYIGENRIIHVYGPTESTVFATYYFIDKINEDAENIPIGSPIANTMIYIVGENNKLSAIGTPGEICISGEGLAREYLNNRKLTTEKFTKNPFIYGDVMYRTGDLGRWIQDGNIEFLGRIDHQVKIRGFRIEIGEIEHELLNYKGIKETIVIDRKDSSGNKYLCAYYVADRELIVGEIRSNLSEKLPGYMIPAYFIQLEKMPLTSNGKIDRRILPEENINITAGSEYEAPRNEIEETLVAVWSEVLGVDRVGINDNFFEIGGHSLKAIVLISKIYKELEVEIPIKEIFKAPTIEGISKYIESTTQTIYHAIEKIGVKEYYEVSSAQKRMYMLQQFDLQSIGYNIPMILEVRGPLDLEKLEISFKRLVERHETLRTCFETIGDLVVQKINNELEINVEYIGSLYKEFECTYNKQLNEEKIHRLVNEFIRPFDLSKAPLLRVGVIKLSDESCILMIDMHHIISDGVSMGILINEFTTIYEGKELEALTIQYKDYSKWQNKLLNSEVMKKQEDYWISKFSGEIPVLNITTDYVRPALQCLEGDNISFTIDSNLIRELKKVAMETGCTMYMVLLSGINILLSKYSGQEDIIIGSAIAGRPHADLQKIIGMFVNTLAIRNYPKGNKIYKDFLKEIKQNSLEAYENQEYQFEEMIDKLNIVRDISRNPLFDVMFTMQNMDAAELHLKDLKFKAYKQKCKTAKFDLTFAANEMEEEILINLEYSTKLYKRRTIETMIGHFNNILKAIVMNANVCIDEIDMFSEEEKHKLLYDFNDTYTNYPRHKTISELFEQQVASSPNNIAVALGEEKLTYRQLNEKANALALTLREKGVEQNSIVGIMVERSVDMIVGIMAILKAGGAYLPIDSDYPVDRIKYMLEDSRVEILLTQNKLIESKLYEHASQDKVVLSIQDKLMSFIEFKGEVLDLERESVYSSCIDNLENINKPEDLIYVIYTSGSTGKPKGTKVMHYNVIRGVKNTNYINITEEDTILQLSNYAFDGSVFDIYGALLNGAKLILIEKENVFDIDKLGDIIIDKKISVFFITTSLFNTLVDNKLECFRYIRKVLVGGERISISHARKALEYMGPDKIINGYGPTESTIFATYYAINHINENDENIPIGSPISNTKIYIIGKNNMLSAIGVPGEIYIAGEGLADGYLNNQSMTDEKFIENPFAFGEKMYKTGDLGRWLLDGNIEFLGRIDHQVKLRGFRIELGEIENELLSHEYIKEVFVMDRKDKNENKYLCAYFIANKELTVNELRKYLSKNLPEYMLPSNFIQLEKIPLTQNGKVDRNILIETTGNIIVGIEYEAPRNKIEEKLVEIWREELAVDKVGINDNFFELGGHSLKAAVLASRIHKELNIEITLRKIFKTPTIKGLSEFIENGEQKVYEIIKPVEVSEYYEASSAQKRMYILQQFDLKSVGYNMPIVMEVEGCLDVKKVEKAFNELIARHETLRTSFDTVNETIIQRLSKEVDFKMEFTEKTHENIEDIINSFITPFDLDKAPLLRVAIIKLEEDKYILMFDMHHIISDGVSMAILVREFAKLYEGEELDKLAIQYKDFAHWQNEFLTTDKIKKQEEYWVNRFLDEIPILNMPVDFARPVVQSFEGDNISFKFGKELTSELRRIAMNTGSTMYMVILSGVNILLSKYSGQDDIVIGTPIAGRSHADLQNIIGMFVNTLAMRNYPEGNKTYEKFLKEVKEASLKAYENQEYQFQQLVSKSNISKDVSRNPLFDVMFSMGDIDVFDVDIKDLIFKAHGHGYKTSKFDLTIAATECDDELVLNFEYCTKLFKRETIERMLVHFENIFKAVATKIDIKLNEIEILTEEEKYKIVHKFNDTCVDYQRNKVIHELFEEQVEKTPNNVAVVFCDKILTYKQLNEKANRLARTLRERGVKSDSIVGIMTSRSFEMIVGMVAILKAGGAYLPIDPEYPEDRIKYMLEDSKTNIILTQNRFKENVVFNGEILDLECESIYVASGENIENINTSRDLAYVIYTSGSTGKPKGVMIEHSSVVNTLTWFVDKYSINQEKNVMNLTEYTFDPSVEQIFTTLISGAKLYIPIKEEMLDKNKFATYVTNNKINVMNFIPAMVKELLLDNVRFETLDTIIVGGDILEDSVKDKLMKLEYNVFNHYGLTETTIDALSATCKKGEKVTLGRPIQNTEVYILDKENNVVPIGVCGEICISGVGLARGYLNRPELTLEKFIENPFAAGKKMYKTGDLAKFLPDGSIEFLGRIDYQVKIRGFRIELGEVENELLAHKDIKEVVAIDKTDENGNKYLCAYFISNRQLIVSELRDYLSNNLPNYMIPAYFIQLEKIPLTENGKIGRNELPEPDGIVITGVKYEAPRNKIEEKLVEIWMEELGVKKIGINDNFFELGGHSLRATTVVSKIHKGLNVEVPLREIFKFPTIKGISEYIESTERSIYSSIEIVEEKEYYEASSAQKRMYVLQQFDLKSTGYNMPGVMLVEGRLNIERLEKSFNELIIRHETLRTSIETIEDKIVQRVNESVNFKLDCFKVGKVENQEEAVDNIVRGFIKAFDLNKAPLLRAGLIKLEEKKYILMYDMHHIICDGVSMRILINEFVKIYEGNELEKLRIQYKDYSQWQNNLLKSEVMQEQKEYWINRFKDEIPVLNIRADFQRPIIQSFEGKNISFKLDRELTKNLKRISKETTSTMYMVLLSAVNILLSKYSGQEDIIVGSPIAGRPHADLDKIIGMFVNTLAMRNYPEGSRTYEDFLKEVKENALKAYENGDYQFDELVDKLSIPRDISRNPLFDVMFTMQNMDSEEIHLKDLVFKEYKQDCEVAKFDLTFSASEMLENIILNLEYSTKLYKRETIETMIEHFVNILKVVATDTKIKLSEIDMITEGEKHKLLYKFNDNYADYPRDKTIQELFEKQVKKTPDAVAVVFEEKKLTYRELNGRANSLAKKLRAKGVRSDSIVGMMVKRSAYMIVGIMGILKAGGAYLPIDSEYPEERIKYMLEDSKVDILLIQNKLKDKITFKGELLDLEDEKNYGGTQENLDVINSSRNLAYVIYTSGSTGNPKGVMIEHKNVLSLTFALLNDIYSHYGSNLNVALVAPYVFDASVQQIFPAILLGHRLFIAPEEVRTSGELLLEYYNDNLIDISDVTPVHMNMLVNARHKENTSLNVKCFIIGGDVLPCETVRNFFEKFGEIKLGIVNIYGPTECCVDSIFYEINMNKIKDLETIPIGKPMCNESIYILGKNIEILPLGIVGEIYIAGEGVGRGYLNRPELTAEKFIESPFVFGERMYKTGDLARWLPDGNIEFLGRIDNQVKLRGFRIELGEIESQLLTYEKVKEAIVMDRTDKKGDKYLCAYVVCEGEISSREIKQYLSGKLPTYMIPSHIIQLENMPATTSGKADRNALNKMQIEEAMQEEYIEPRTEVEFVIVKVWEEVLGINRIGINDNFFDLGGDSMKAIRVVMNLSRDYEIAVNDIFEHQTPASLSQNIYFKKDALRIKLKRFKEMSNEFNAIEAMKNKVKLQMQLNEYKKANKKYKNVNLTAITTYNNILITGVTGYLGIHVLYEILKSTSSNIYLIIRGSSKEVAEEKLIKRLSYYFHENIFKDYKHRLNVLNGDLSNNYLGLDKENYYRLSEVVDCIINSAANVKHYGKYEELYDTNVKGTNNLIDFAKLSKLKDFNHISTVSIGSGIIKNKKVTLFTEYDCDMGQETENYYIKTKLEGELAVFKAREDGLNCNIFRVGNLVFNSNTGKFQENVENNAFYSIIKSQLNLKLMPKISSDILEFSFIDYVSKAIVLLFDKSNLKNEVYHIKNSQLISYNKLGEFMKKVGYTLELVSIDEFIEYISSNYDKEYFREDIEKLLLHLQLLDTEGVTQFVLACDKTEWILSKLGFEWKQLSEELVRKMMKHGEQVGFFKKSLYK